MRTAIGRYATRPAAVQQMKIRGMSRKQGNESAASGDLESGGGGIRTHERLAASLVFKTSAIDRSATPPGSCQTIVKPAETRGKAVFTAAPGLSGGPRPFFG